jgi:hypothetical protein
MSPENGANVGGDVDTGGGNFVGRDQLIQNIVIVGQFLDYTGIRKLIPDLSSQKEFAILNNISEGLIEKVHEQYPSDLATSLAFVGYIMKDFLSARLQVEPFTIVNTRVTMDLLAKAVGENLYKLGYWSVFQKEFKDSNSQFHHGRMTTVIPLISTTDLLLQNTRGGEKVPTFFLERTESSSFARESETLLVDYHFTEDIVIQTTSLDYSVETHGMEIGIRDCLLVENFTGPETRIFWAGVIVDLIRLHSIAHADNQFWQSVAKLLKVQGE